MKIATYNINFDQKTWSARKDPIVKQLKVEQLDIICLQEIVDEGTVKWLADQLGMPYIYTNFRTQAGKHGVIHGISTLSRHPFVSEQAFFLEEQGRVCNAVEIELQQRSIVICNGHYFWHPGESPIRYAHVSQTLKWLEGAYSDSIRVLAGDFNEEPNHASVVFIKRDYASAHEAVHGCEPEATCDSSRVAFTWKQRLKKVLGQSWKGTLDYIFYDPQRMQVLECYLSTTRTPEGWYVSDHSAIVAELVLKP